MEELKIQEDCIKDIKVVGGGQIPMAVFYDDKKCEDFLTEFKGFVNSVDKDISTAEGRKSINSMAYDIGRMKKPIEEAGKGTIEEIKERVKAVDKRRIKLVNTIEEIQIGFRKDLTDFENKEKQRVARLEQSYRDLETLGDFSFDIPTIESVTLRINQANTIINRDWEEFKDKALDTHEKLINKLNDMLARLIKEKADSEELERLRKLEDDIKQKARDEEIATKAKNEAINEEKKKADDLAKKVADDKIKADKELEDAKNAAKKAKEDSDNAIKKAEQDILDKIAEDKRIEDEQQAKREANKAHKKRINNETIDDIIALGIEKDLAKKLIIAIIEEKIRNVNIKY